MTRGVSGFGNTVKFRFEIGNLY